MKLVKPQQLSLLTRTFENEGQTFLVLSALAGVDLSAPRRLVHEASFWKLAAETLGKTPLDEAMTKRRGEVLVAGSAFSKDGVAAAATSVRVKIATVDKELYVVGDREWQATGMTLPAPFVEMPVTWERAFGGEGFDENPIGRGVKAVDEEGIARHRLPNVEDPKHLVKAKGDRPPPAGLGPIDIAWPQRTKKAGTYDDLWLSTRYPDFAADFDWSFFNVAPLGQQIEGYFAGDEEFEIHGMHPAARVLRGRLPGLAARFVVSQRRDDGTEHLREPQSRLDTVFFFPNASRAILVYRAVVEIGEDDAKDVEALIAAFEDPSAPKPLAHYLGVRDKRADKKYGALHSLTDRDLLPDGVAIESPLEASDAGELARTERLMTKRVTRKVERGLAAARERALAAGMDPAEVDAKIPAKVEPMAIPTDSSELVELVESTLEDARAHRERALEEMKQALRATSNELSRDGVPVDVETLARGSGGPPPFRADKQLELLRDLARLKKNAGYMTEEEERRFHDPALEAMLRDAEERILGAYRRFAHFWPAAADRDPAENQALRARVMAAKAAGESLSGRDLTGADLSELDLSGVDLRRALLEKTRLRGTRLEGANLEGATLARADLTTALLGGAKLAGANFGRAILAGTHFGERADLVGAIFYDAKLAGASLAGARLDGAQFLETSFVGSDLSDACLDKTVFMGADLTDVKLDRAHLAEAIFMDATLDRASFVAADLSGATMVRTHGEDVRFAGAILVGARIVLETSLPRADFTRARFKRTCMRTTRFSGANFSEAEMPEVDLSECDLTGATLFKVNAPSSLFIRADLRGATLMSANLMNGIFQKAKLAGTDLRGANLFRADMAKAKGDAATRFDDAYRVQVRVVPEKRKQP